MNSINGKPSVRPTPDVVSRTAGRRSRICSARGSHRIKKTFSFLCFSSHVSRLPFSLPFTIFTVLLSLRSMTVYSILKTIIVSAVNDIVQEHRKMNDNVQLWININKKENLHNLTKNSTFSKSIFAHLLIMYYVHKRDLFLHIYTEIKKKTNSE